MKEGKEYVVIIIDYSDRRPIYEQIVERIQMLILNGGLAQGEQLPSVRNLAMELSINPNTIQKAYAELERQGFVYSIKGKGSFIAANDHVLEKRKGEFIETIGLLVKKAISFGVTQDQLIYEIKKCYEEDEKND